MQKYSKTKFLILTDFLSGFSTYFHFKQPPTSRSVIERLTNFFHLNTWPAILASDGEGLLTSHEFRHWLKNNNVLVRQCAGEDSQSNGLAESSVKSFRRLWEKCQAANDDFVQGWSLWNDTPREPGQLSPSRQWFGRPIRHPGWFIPPERSPVDTLVAAQEAYIRRKESSTAFNPQHRAYCNTTKPPKLTVGKHVLVEDKDSGAFDIPGIVMSISDTGRSARVKRSDTNISLLRNSKGIKIDPQFITPVIVGSVNGLSPPGGDRELGDTSQDRGDTPVPRSLSPSATTTWSATSTPWAGWTSRGKQGGLVLGASFMRWTFPAFLARLSLGKTQAA